MTHLGPHRLAATGLDAEEKQHLSACLRCRTQRSRPGPELRSARAFGDGRYDVLRKLGSGGMAEVLLVRDTRLAVLRAIKVLHRRHAEQVTIRGRFEGEARTLARIDHPHMVTVHDVGVADGLPFIVMEYVEGGSLLGWVERNGPMPPRLAARAMSEALAGLAEAHAQGIVHRDVKPDNLLVTARGNVLLGDFGVARDPTSLRAPTRDRAVIGTPAYMAPEQQGTASVDARADLFAAGRTLWFLLTGRLPEALGGRPAAPTGKVPVPLDAIIVAATRSDPGDRYPNADTMRQALLEAVPLLPPDPLDTPSLAGLSRAWEVPTHDQSTVQIPTDPAEVPLAAGPAL